MEVSDGTGLLYNRYSMYSIYGYTNNALYQHRNPEPHLLQKYESIYNHISNYYQFSAGIFHSSPIKIVSEYIERAKKLVNQCVLTKTLQKYNITHYAIRTPTGSYLSFIKNDTIDSAEKSELHSHSHIETTALLLYLKQLMIREKIEYFEKSH